MALRLDREGAIKALEQRGIAPADAASIVGVIHDFLVIPAVETMATKTGERSARGRLRSRIEEALTAIGVLKSDVAGLKTDVAGIRTDVDSLKESVKGLRELTLWGIGSSTAFLGLLIAIVGLAK